MESKRKTLDHLAKVYRGEVNETELDHSQQVVTLIPVLLKSSISLELKSFLLQQYAEIKGHLRDQNMALLSRSDFYDQAAEMAELEKSYAAEREAYGEYMFKELVDYLEDDVAEAINKTAEEHELFKSQMPDVIKSSLGMAEDDVIGPDEVKDFEEKDREF